ncbi:hypothetical protein AVEN_227078-1 [Araneus ventricosus]|uniref:DUF4817 domain-containing protein n=1 Tax=Araneus ventricosus TaxID=182803 RepID=A0A4Y2CAI1_ARAVE|nr:hypothetical protein AVEN_227078-1 [Araneus ventricosus]
MATVQQKARLWFQESQSIETVQRIIRLEYRNCQSPSKNSINHWYERFKGKGNVRQSERLSLLNCSYQRLMGILLADRQFRFSNRIILRTVTIGWLSWNQRRVFCCTVAILALTLDCADLVRRNGALRI